MGNKNRKILVNVSQDQLEKFKKFIEKRNYNFRSEAIRDAILLLLESQKSIQLQNKLNDLKNKDKLIEPTPEFIKQNIIGILSKNRNGLNIKQISEILQIHRHTVRKYVTKLIFEKIIVQRKIGIFKICFLKREGRI